MGVSGVGMDGSDRYSVYGHASVPITMQNGSGGVQSTGVGTTQAAGAAQAGLAGAAQAGMAGAAQAGMAGAAQAGMAGAVQAGLAGAAQAGMAGAAQAGLAGAAQAGMAGAAGSSGAAGVAGSVRPGAPAGETTNAQRTYGTADMRMLKRMGAVECQTCKNRTYQDGSNDPGVSFKAPGHIDPASAGSVVMGHEQEHVANEQTKAESEGSRVVSQSVRIFTAVCPECGRVYVSGGETRTVTASDDNTKQAASLYKTNGNSASKLFNRTV